MRRIKKEENTLFGNLILHGHGINELTPPYYSGYAQAVGIVVLIHAYNLTNNDNLLK